MIKTNQSLNGKHALVTGGSRGIGFAIAQALLQQGARVTLVARSLGALQLAVEQLSPLGQVQALALDVTDNDAVIAVFDQAVQQFGTIDILINNAGQAHSAAFLKTAPAVFQNMFAVNVNSVVACTQAVLPAMLQQRWGRIVNVASTAASTGYAYVSAYCAAKHAVLGLTRALALEVAQQGVTVNAVSPGFTETDMLENTVANIVAKTGRTPEQARTALAANNPQGQLIQPEQVAHAVIWLCMPAAAAMNGQSISVDGGELM